jgi:hypothetical protein
MDCGLAVALCAIAIAAAWFITAPSSCFNFTDDQTMFS